MTDGWKPLAEVRIGDRFERPLLLEKMTTETASTGTTYLKLILSDGKTKKSVAEFNRTRQNLLDMGISEGHMVYVNLEVDDYKGGPSLKIININADNTTDISDYIITPPLGADMMFDYIINTLKSVADDFGGMCTPLSELATLILENYRVFFIRSSAAISMHHNHIGGLLWHTYCMVRSAVALSQLYENIDKELLVCGAALHDIGKIKEYSTSDCGSATFTPDGVLFGHPLLGYEIINDHLKCFVPNPGYHSEKVRLLKHLIVSHHGKREYGAASMPAIPEATLLHMIDDIDAKMNMYRKVYEELRLGETTPKKVYGLDSYVYRHFYDTGYYNPQHEGFRQCEGFGNDPHGGYRNEPYGGFGNEQYGGYMNEPYGGFGNESYGGYGFGQCEEYGYGQ